MSSFTPKTVIQIPRLNEQAVHVWNVNLEYDAGTDGEGALKASELAKINRLRNPKHRAYAASMRIQLRQLLALYLDVEAADIVFDKAEFGKPYITNSNLSFNVSHSDNQALVAVSFHKELGVDIECWRTLDNLEALVQRNFSDDEKKCWLELPDVQREAVFFRLWTCKEAFIKATGRGLGMGVSRCGFELEPPHEIKLCPAEYGEASAWRCRPLEVGDRVSGSIIVKTKSFELSTYSFDPEKPPQITLEIQA